MNKWYKAKLEPGQLGLPPLDLQTAAIRNNTSAPLHSTKLNKTHIHLIPI